MPLIHKGSKKALEHNIKTEMEAHPDQRDRNLAISYSIQRRAKGKKMADGGVVGYGKGPEEDREPHMHSGEGTYPSVSEDEYDADRFVDGREHFAHGGQIDMDEDHDHDGYSEDMITGEHEEPLSVVEAIMRRKPARMARGGEVDLAEHSEESPNMEDDMSYDAIKKEMYDMHQVDDQPEDSNEHGRDIDGDKHDMVNKLRMKIRAKRGM